MKIPCPHCGSENTKCIPDVNNLVALLEKLLPKKRSFPGGRYVVKCKECGHKGIVMVN